MNYIVISVSESVVPISVSVLGSNFGRTSSLAWPIWRLWITWAGRTVHISTYPENSEDHVVLLSSHVVAFWPPKGEIPIIPGWFAAIRSIFSSFLHLSDKMPRQRAFGTFVFSEFDMLRPDLQFITRLRWEESYSSISTVLCLSSSLCWVVTRCYLWVDPVVPFDPKIPREADSCICRGCDELLPCSQPLLELTQPLHDDKGG